MKEQLLLHFTKAGLQTLVQDQGRLSYLNAGIPVGGAMDSQAAILANYLVGNEPESPVLEITILGPTIIFQGKGQIAICGADLSAKINGRTLDIYETIQINDGDILNFGQNKSGCRAYLAIGGQWLLPQWLGSYSAAAYNGQNLTPESIIKKGSQLAIQPRTFINKRKTDLQERTNYSNYTEVKVNCGPEFDRFSSIEIGRFFSQTYHLSTASNRMGYRMEETIIDLRTNTNIISSAMIPGTVQITSSGQPIVLMMDAQTTGGYARIVNVISEDLSKLGQAKPGDRIRFCLIENI